MAAPPAAPKSCLPRAGTHTPRFFGSIITPVETGSRLKAGTTNGTRSRGIAPERWYCQPPKSEGGNADARCIRDLMRNGTESARMAYRAAEKSDIPCAMALRLIVRSPR